MTNEQAALAHVHALGRKMANATFQIKLRSRAGLPLKPHNVANIEAIVEEIHDAMDVWCRAIEEADEDEGRSIAHKKEGGRTDTGRTSA